jgi:hypothetical protein
MLIDQAEIITFFNGCVDGSFSCKLITAHVTPTHIVQDSSLIALLDPKTS